MIKMNSPSAVLVLLCGFWIAGSAATVHAQGASGAKPGATKPAPAQPAAPPQGPPPGPVVVTPVIERTVRTGATFVGTVLPEQRAAIGSAVDGRVVEFPVNEGDRVEAGQTLAQLLTETIRLELEAAQGELELRQSELEELENGTRPEEIEEARAQMEAARANLKLAQRRLERTQRLYREGNAATEDQLDEAAAAADRDQAVLDERQAAYAMALSGPRKEQIRQAQARVAMQKAVVERLKDQLTKHTIIARFSGYVTVERTEVGQWVNRGDVIAEIAALDRVDVLANVLESHVPFIRDGQDARVEVPALPNRVFTGKVVSVVPEGDQRSRTFPVKVRLNNEFEGRKPLLNAGMLARVTLPTGPEKTAKLVPKDAIVLGGPAPMVYTVVGAGPDGKGGKTRPVPVVLGISKGSLVEVDGDLAAGEPVVVLGNERLRPGQEVFIARVMDSSTEAPSAAGQPSQP